MNIEEKLDQLINFGASAIDHLDGSLIKHLKGTYTLLKQWNADIALCIAGAYHAVYGTSGFDKTLISEKNRKTIKDIIGTEAEQIVYTYCACDRDFFWPQIGTQTNPLFLDRFTDSKYHLSINELQFFCELTVANELEIATDNIKFIKEYGESLQDLLSRMTPYISIQANNHIKTIFGSI